MREILKASEERIAAGEGLAAEDRDFHLEIVRATQNSVFHKVCSAYYVMGEARLPIYFKDPERNRRSHAEHLQIFDALVRRDGNLAQALMSAHLQGVESYWKGLLGERRRMTKAGPTRRSRKAEPCRSSFPRIRCIPRPPHCWRAAGRSADRHRDRSRRR